MRTEASKWELFRLVGRYVKRYPGLVLLVLLFGVLQAFFMKGPILLLEGISNILLEGDQPPREELQFVYLLIEDLKDSLLSLFGIEVGADSGPVGKMAGYLLILAFAAPLGAVSVYLFRVLANLFTTRSIVELRNEVCTHLMGLSLRFFSKQRIGDLISRITNDVNSIRATLTLVVENVVAEPLLLLGNVAIAWYVHPYIGLVVFAIIPLLVLPMKKMGRKVQRNSGKSLEALGDTTDVMAQMFAGFRTVKAFQLEKQEVQEFRKGNERFLIRTMRMLKAKALSQGVTFLIYMLGLSGILVLLGFLSETMSSGKITLAVYALGTAYQHVKRLTRCYNLIKESEGALDRILVIFEEEKEISDHSDAGELDRIRGEIEFQDVHFSYESEPVLQGLSFTVRAGEKIAFVGPSGAGKSTILNLLARFYDPDRGAILVDGKDLRSFRLSSYLSQIATVDQSPFLFNRTIRENILLGKPGATESEVAEAARIALVDEFVETLPGGFETIVGERGSALSGGQLQRITIARAVIRDPRILLLDEATSALDTESEKAVQAALDNLMKGRTSFIIAHRLSTIRSAGRIFVLEQGRVVEAGSHQELMERPAGIYRRLKGLQV